MKDQMRIAVLEEKEKCRLREKPVPSISKEEILVKVEACAICTFDQRVYTGVKKVNLPFVGGHEIFGTVVEIGSAVNTDHWNRDDKVAVGLMSSCGDCYYCDSGEEGLCQNFSYNKVVGGLPYSGTGGFSSYLAVSPQTLFKTSHDLTKEVGVFTEPLSCVIHSVNKAAMTIGEEAIVIGAGTMGILHLLVLKNSGMIVTVSEPDEKRRKTALDFGADYVIDPANENVEELVKERTGGRGMDAVFSAIASLDVTQKIITLAGPNGRVILYSSVFPNDKIWIDPNWIHKTMVTITGSANSNRRDFLLAAKMLSNGTIDPSPLVSEVYPLEKINEAMKESIKLGNYRTIITF